MQKAILTKGLIASGKSWWAKEFLKQNKNYKRVNRDLIRFCLSDYQFDDENEKLVQKVWKQVVKEILEFGYNLVVDEQNLNPKTRKSNIDYIKSIVPDIEIEIKNFPITLEEAIMRDKLRDFVIGEKVIKRTWHKYKDELIEMLEDSNKPKVTYNPLLPDCLIVDIDGTLAIRGNRNPYDYSKIHEDKINEPVLHLVNCLSDSLNMHDTTKESQNSITIFSGRDDNCFVDTFNWLCVNCVKFDKLVMRKTGDKRKDSIVKKEMYEEHIKGKYNVRYVIDDRKQVVDMWRQELGLTVLDVAGNTF
jgi:predicted kinase